MGTICSQEGCDKPVYARGWCQNCYAREYQRARRAGTPWTDGRKARALTLAERAWKYVDRSGGSDACWPWTGALDRKGYGQLGVNVGGVWRFRRAHRIIYELVRNHLPVEDFDHLCHTRDESCPGGDNCPHRRCVNPAHMEPVTNRQNSVRGQSRAGKAARAKRCKYGHPWSEENTIWYRGTRRCRACAQRQARDRNAARATCERGHEWTPGNTGYDKSGKRICLACAAARRKTACKRGHAWTEENTRWYRGKRQCRACGREYIKAHWARATPAELAAYRAGQAEYKRRRRASG